MNNKISVFLWSRKYIVLFVSLFIIVLTQRFLSTKQNGLANSIYSDGYGYYCYLPAAIIYQDFTYSFYKDNENNIKSFYQPIITPYKTKGINKYYCGTSICLLPFFLIGILISIIAGTDVNGYTDTFLMLVSVAAIFYYLISIFLITKIAKFFSIPKRISFVGCLVVFFGTNYFHYTIQEPSMSHCYSFFAISLFLYLFVRLLENISLLNLLLLSMSLSLIILIRPVNIVIILFTPFFFENIKEYFIFLKKIISNYLLGLILFILTLLALVSVQFVFYYLQTGDFFILAYEGETFNFLRPEFFNVLFSYRKGLLLYVPILFGTVVFVLLMKNFWYKKTIFFITLFVFLYITSSWWCWSYGGGLSIRPIVDILPVFVIISILLINELNARKKKLVLFFTIPFMFFNQLLAYQYSNYLIDIVNMDEEKYWDVFLETNYYSVYENKKSRILKNKLIVKTDSMNFDDFTFDNIIVYGGYKSDKACLVGKINNYSKGFSLQKKDISVNESLYILVECMVKPIEEDDKNLALVVAMLQNETIMEWNVVFRCHFKENEDGWIKMVNIVEIDKSHLTDNLNLKVFVNSEKGKSLVDDLKYSMVEK